MHEEITIDHAKAFILNLMISGNYPGSFSADDERFRRALVTVARGSKTLRPFVGRLFSGQAQTADGKRLYDAVKSELVAFWLVRDTHHASHVKLNDVAINVARELRPLLTPPQLNDLKAHGPDFMKALAAA